MMASTIAPELAEAMTASARPARASMPRLRRSRRLTVETLASNGDVAAACRDRYRWISVDEFQDVDEQQYRLLTLLAPSALASRPRRRRRGRSRELVRHWRSESGNLWIPRRGCVVLRALQSGLRWRSVRAPHAQLPLDRNDRRRLVAGDLASSSSSSSSQERPIADIVREMHERITIHVAPSDRAEAELVVRTIEELMGGHDLFTLDTGRFTLFTVSSRSNRSDSFAHPRRLWQPGARRPSTATPDARRQSSGSPTSPCCIARMRNPPRCARRSRDRACRSASTRTNCSPINLSCARCWMSGVIPARTLPIADVTRRQPARRRQSRRPAARAADARATKATRKPTAC